MRAVAASGRVCGARRSGLADREDEWDRKPHVKVNFITARPGERSWFAVAARLEGLGGFGRCGQRRGRCLLFCDSGARAAASGFGGRLIRAIRRDRQKTTPPLGKDQEEGIAEDQTSHQQAHTVILRRIGEKSLSQHAEVLTRVPNRLFDARSITDRAICRAVRSYREPRGITPPSSPASSVRHPPFAA